MEEDRLGADAEAVQGLQDLHRQRFFILKKWRNYGSFRVFSEGKSNLYWYGCNSTSDQETCGQTKGCACHSVRRSKIFF